MVDSSDPQAMLDKLKEVLADEAYVKELAAMEKVEDVQTALEQKGVSLTKDELLRIRDAIVKAKENGVSADELSEDQLEGVAGGFELIICGIIGVAAIITGGVLGWGW